MKLEEQVCTFQQAKKLAELGLELETGFYWMEAGKEKKQAPTLISASKAISQTGVLLLPAPTVAELGVLLPAMISTDDEDLYLQGTIGDRRGEFYYIWFQSSLDNVEWELFPAIEKDTEAEARAAALIWLLENDFIKIQNLSL